MKKETNLILQKYRKTLQDAVQLGVKYHMARKALVELPYSYTVELALMEIASNSEHYNKVVKTTTRNIAVLELREGI